VQCPVLLTAAAPVPQQHLSHSQAADTQAGILPPVLSAKQMPADMLHTYRHTAGVQIQVHIIHTHMYTATHHISSMPCRVCCL
jgi:hypothetical protein